MTLEFDAGETVADRMRSHAGESSHLYGHLMRAMADDWEADGPTREICRGWEQAPPGAVIQLRLLAGLFRIVLTDRAPELVQFYPCLGGRTDPAAAWPAVRVVLHDHVDELHDALEVAPQTNEVGRSQALLVGLFDAVRSTGVRRVRLLEPGASAGLNLLVDRFAFSSHSWSFGPADSPLHLHDWLEGQVEPASFEIVERAGCDLAPVDATTTDGQLRLRSFVWPFHVERHERLSAAFAVVAEHPVSVERAAAGEWLERQLGLAQPDDVLTVVWQSITQLYWPADEVARVHAAMDSAGRSGMALAHVAMEYPTDGSADTALLSVGMAGVAGKGDVVATVGDHGTPVAMIDR